jgi:hypothetical protein
MDDAEFKFAKSIHDRALREVPEEKAQIILRQAQIARIMQASGSIKSDGMGQKIAGIDPRLYFRWQQENPGFWRDPASVRQFLKDNPQCCAPGYKPEKGYRPTETIVYT